MTAIDIGLIELFDDHLKSKGIFYEASIVGGSAIMLVASGHRPTGDIDSLQKIPDDVRVEIAAFATIRGLDPRWSDSESLAN